MLRERAFRCLKAINYPVVKVLVVIVVVVVVAVFVTIHMDGAGAARALRRVLIMITSYLEKGQTEGPTHKEK